MSEEHFESLNVNDVPDSWYDLIQDECLSFLDRMELYPPGLVIMVIQVIFQNYIYISLSKEDRAKFLKVVLDTFIDQFNEWDKQRDPDRDQETDSNDI